MKTLALIFCMLGWQARAANTGFFQFSPQQVPSLCFLFLPENATPSQWTDVSGNAFNGVMSTNAVQPTITNNYYGNYPAVWFTPPVGVTNSPQYYLWTNSASIIGANNSWEFYAMAKSISTVGNSIICDGQASNNDVFVGLWTGTTLYWDSRANSSSGRVSLTVTAAFENTNNILDYVTSNIQSWIFTNGVQGATGGVSGSPAGGAGSALHIGANLGSTPRSSNFVIGPFFGYSNVVSTNNRTLLNRWIAARSLTNHMP